jgi:mannose-6-phosphate isomerase-like protein (cupin superfamily)
MRRLILLVFLTTLLPAQTPEVEITAEPHHHQIFANAQVRVFNVEVPPYSDTLMHWHRHDYIYVTLGDSQVVNAVKGKDPVTVSLHDGDTFFLPAPFAHVARNLSDKPFRNVTIELLQDEKLRHAPPHWDPAHPEADRGLDILHGGTRQILWVHDAVRASEFELQPNAALPADAHSHPLLLIALTDLDLYLNEPHRHDAHQPAVPASHFHTGDSRWLPAGLHHPITNAGKQSAKFITLEFH